MTRRHLAHAVLVAALLPWGLQALAADATTQAKPAGNPHRPAHATAAIKPVDINSASAAELKTLPGIGDAEAAKIIAARPYPSKAKLAVDKVLSDGAYRALQGRIVAIPPAPSKRKPADKPSGQS